MRHNPATEAAELEAKRPRDPEAAEDFKAHEQTYLAFLQIVKWVTILSAVVLLLLAYFTL